jgi:hypothetical protein
MLRCWYVYCHNFGAFLITVAADGTTLAQISPVFVSAGSAYVTLAQSFVSLITLVLL